MVFLARENSATTKKAMEFPLIVFRQYLKEWELDEDQLVLSKAKLRFSFALIQQVLVRFPRRSRWYFVRNKFSGRMIKQWLNSVPAKYRDLSVSRK